MQTAQEKNQYKSPKYKLIIFFEKSRNQWKNKCQSSKAENKLLKNRIRFLEESKDKFKARAKILESEVLTVKKELESLKKKLIIKPDESEPSYKSRIIDFFDIVPFGHTYPIGQIMLFLQFVLIGGASFKCAARSIRIILLCFNIPIGAASWYSGRLWLLRFGCYKLTRAKEIANDWVWIVDTIIQAGVEKCLVILGIRLSDIPPKGTCLKHEDVEPIDLVPVKHANGDIVYEKLENAIAKTGIPREIVGDHASDLKTGIDKFCNVHTETSYVYDIKHKSATILKHELKKDPAWVKFTRLAAQTKQDITQTELAFLGPPNQKSKARYMNLNELIQWGLKILCYIDNLQTGENKSIDSQKVNEKLGWIAEFREYLGQWNELSDVVKRIESFVREQGLYLQCDQDLRKQLQDLPMKTERTKRVCLALVDFVSEESTKAKLNERLIGSSEVLESVLGKLKQIEKNQSKSGFNSLILSIAAMVSVTDEEVVEKALNEVSTKQVLDWCNETIGKTVQQKRKEELKCPTAG